MTPGQQTIKEVERWRCLEERRLPTPTGEDKVLPSQLKALRQREAASATFPENVKRLLELSSENTGDGVLFSKIQPHSPPEEYKRLCATANGLMKTFFACRPSIEASDPFHISFAGVKVPETYLIIMKWRLGYKKAKSLGHEELPGRDDVTLPNVKVVDAACTGIRGNATAPVDIGRQPYLSPKEARNVSKPSHKDNSSKPVADIIEHKERTTGADIDINASESVNKELNGLLLNALVGFSQNHIGSQDEFLGRYVEEISQRLTRAYLQHQMSARDAVTELRDQQGVAQLLRFLRTFFDCSPSLMSPEVTRTTRREFVALSLMTGGLAEAKSEAEKGLGTDNDDLGLLELLGRIQRQRDEHTEEEETFKRLLQLARSRHDDYYQACALRGMAMCALVRHDCPIAIRHLLSALRLDWTSEHPLRSVALSQDYTKLSICYRSYRTKCLHRAETLCKAAITWSREAKSDLGVAILHGHLGVISRIRKDFAGAERHYRISLDINQRIKHRIGVCGALSNLGEIAMDRGDYVMANDFFGRALDHALEVGRPMGISTQYRQLGRSARLRAEQIVASRKSLNRTEQQKLRDARAMLEKAIAIDEGPPRKHGLANEYWDLGVINMHLKELHLADEQLTKSQNLFKELDKSDLVEVVGTYINRLRAMLKTK